MKTIIYLIGLTIIFSTTFNQQKQVKKSKYQAEIKQNSDSLEYELIIFDSGFETYLAKVPHSKDFYGNDYYRNWNIRYVSEWNLRASNPLKYGAFYESTIDYQASIDYGLDLNYKLYYYFQYIKDVHGIVLIKRK